MSGAARSSMDIIGLSLPPPSAGSRDCRAFPAPPWAGAGAGAAGGGFCAALSPPSDCMMLWICAMLCGSFSTERIAEEMSSMAQISFPSYF